MGFASQLRLRLCWVGLAVLCAQRWHWSQQSESLPLEPRTLLDNKSLPCRLLGPKYADSHSSQCRSVSGVLPTFSSSCLLEYLTVLPPLYARPPDRPKYILVFLSCSTISIVKVPLQYLLLYIVHCACVVSYTTAFTSDAEKTYHRTGYVN